MKTLPSELRRKADQILHSYGGLEGLSRNPPWVVDIVLKTWFTDAERKAILKVSFAGIRPTMKQLGA